MWSTPSLSLVPGSIWRGVVAPDRLESDRLLSDRLPSMGQIELFDF